MMEEMSVGDMEMEVGWIESRITEMMEVVDQMQDEIRDWLVDRDGDQVMPQVEVTKNIEEDYMEVSVCMPRVAPEVHTPFLGAKLHTDTTKSIMTVLHTPLLGKMCTQDTLDRRTDDMKSGAGINIGGYKGGVQSQRYDTDMRNMQQSHGSPKLNIQIPLNKTPTVVGGKLEMFGSITDMICHWEGMEEKEGGKK